MTISRPGFLAGITAFLATLLFSEPVEACAENKDLLQEREIRMVLEVTPCDPIGFLYLDGLSGERYFSFGQLPRLEDHHIYYGYARIFLHELAALPDVNAEFPGFDDAYANLMLAAYLSQSDSRVSVGQDLFCLRQAGLRSICRTE